MKKILTMLLLLTTMIFCSCGNNEKPELYDMTVEVHYPSRIDTLTFTVRAIDTIVYEGDACSWVDVYIDRNFRSTAPINKISCKKNSTRNYN